MKSYNQNKGGDCSKIQIFLYNRVKMCYDVSEKDLNIQEKKYGSI